jgi:hypothetical protein
LRDAFLDAESEPISDSRRGPRGGLAIEYFGLPGARSARYHAFTIVTVVRAAVARVRRVVVTQEEYDLNHLVVDVPTLPV